VVGGRVGVARAAAGLGEQRVVRHGGRVLRRRLGDREREEQQEGEEGDAHAL